MSDSATRPLTILFMPENGHGPTNQCIGLGKMLMDRGHRVVFAAEASWKGELSALGFEEDLVDLAPPEACDEEHSGGGVWMDYIRETAAEFRKPTIEQLETFMAPTWQALIDTAMYCEVQLRQIIERVKPDVVVEDNVLCFPALMTAGVPFVRIVSCNPLEIKGNAIAPVVSGYAANDDAHWQAFRDEYDRTHRAIWTAFNEFVTANGAPALPDLEFIHTSDAANLYVYPKEADYTDQRPLDGRWYRMDSSVRSTDAAYEIPAAVADRPSDSALIYLSLGSMGSSDVDLMKRLIDVLGRTRHRFIVSMGRQHAQYELADNMVGAQFLPQTSIIPLVDLVITHGGNNTTTESLHFGKPMILLPLFWDQYDNAQRMDELGFGKRLATYTFTEDDMNNALESLLGDADLAERMAAMATAIASRQGTTVGADVIEAVAREHATSFSPRG